MALVVEVAANAAGDANTDAGATGDIGAAADAAGGTKASTAAAGDADADAGAAGDVGAAGDADADATRLAAYAERLAALVGSPAPLNPYFDERAGCVPGPDRVATAALLAEVRAAAPARGRALAAALEADGPGYATLLVVEVSLSEPPRGDAARLARAVAAALTAAVAALVPRVAGVGPPRDAAAAAAATAALPVLARCARHLATIPAARPIVAGAAAALVGVPPLGDGDAADAWGRGFPARDLGRPGPLPEAVAAGAVAGRLADEWTRLRMPRDLAGSARRDADAVWASCGRGDALAALVDLRGRVNAAAPVAYEDSGLRDWTAPGAQVLGAALAACVARLFPPPPAPRVDDADAVGHAVPCCLALMDAYEARGRRAGLVALLRVLQRASKARLGGVAGLARERLVALRGLSTSDGEVAMGLHARCLVRCVALLDEPAARAARGGELMELFVVDATRCRDEPARTELLRRGVAPLVRFLGHGVARHLRTLLPMLLAFLEPGHSERRLLALRAVHAVAAAAWARVGAYREALVPALLGVAGAARRDLVDAAVADARGDSDDSDDGSRPFAPPRPRGFAPDDARVALNNAIRALAFLLVLDPDKAPPLVAAARAACPDLRAVADLATKTAADAAAAPP